MTAFLQSARPGHPPGTMTMFSSAEADAADRYGYRVVLNPTFRHESSRFNEVVVCLYLHRSRYRHAPNVTATNSRNTITTEVSVRAVAFLS